MSKTEDLLTLEVLRLRTLVEELAMADPDYGEDIKEIYSNSIYADWSDSEKELAVTDRMIEHQLIIKELLTPKPTKEKKEDE